MSNHAQEVARRGSSNCLMLHRSLNSECITVPQPFRGRSISSAIFFKNYFVGVDANTHQLVHNVTDNEVLNSFPNTLIKSVHRGEAYWALLTFDGELYMAESALYQQTTLPSLKQIPTPAPFLKLKIGYQHQIARSKDAFYSWGEGMYGALGHGDMSSRTTPTRIVALDSINVKKWMVGGWHNCVLATNGDIYMWGYDSDCKLGNLESTQKANIPLKMCSIGPITDIAIAGYHSCAIVNGQVKSWGGRVNDNLGFQGSSTKNAMTLDNLQDKRPTRLFTNGYGCHTFIINDDKTVYGFGGNGEGQLGMVGDFAAPDIIPNLCGLDIDKIVVWREYSMIFLELQKAPYKQLGRRLYNFSDLDILM